MIVESTGLTAADAVGRGQNDLISDELRRAVATIAEEQLAGPDERLLADIARKPVETAVAGRTFAPCVRPGIAFFQRGATVDYGQINGRQPHGRGPQHPGGGPLAQTKVFGLKAGRAQSLWVIQRLCRRAVDTVSKKHDGNDNRQISWPLHCKPASLNEDHAPAAAPACYTLAGSVQEFLGGLMPYAGVAGKAVVGSVRSA